MNRRALIIGALATVVLVAAWYALLWKPRTHAVSQAKARQEAARQAQAPLEVEISRLKALQRKDPETRARLAALRDAIPDDPNLAQFILDTNDAATRAGIDFVSIAPALPGPYTAVGPAQSTQTTRPATASGAPPAQVTVALQIGGGYFQVLDFINRLDAMPRLVVTDTLAVSSDAQAHLTVSIQARMFLRAVPAGFPGAATTTTTVAGATTTTTAGGRA